MDVNDYICLWVFSLVDGEILLEILQQGKWGLIEEDLLVDCKWVLQLFNGELFLADLQNEVY